MTIRLDQLHSDCSACHSFCCVAPRIMPEHGFAFEKPALVPCRYLLTQPFSCIIHEHLAEHRCHGCVDYTCHGAGPLLTEYARVQGYSWAGLAPGERRRDELLERFLALHALFSALAELREMARGSAALDASLGETEARIGAMDMENLLDSALDLAFEVRGLCWAQRWGL